MKWATHHSSAKSARTTLHVPLLGQTVDCPVVLDTPGFDDGNGCKFGMLAQNLLEPGSGSSR